jgi:hypothetical protein
MTMLSKNGVNINSLYDLDKTYYVDPANPGNAWMEGRLAASYINSRNSAPSKTCRFEDNLIGPCFDGMSLGQFEDSVSKRDVFYYCFDDAVEMEGWNRAHTGRNIAVEQATILNSYGSAISHQDTARQIAGPQYIRRCVIDGPDQYARPAYAIKNMGPMPRRPVIVYDRCFIRNLSGPTGWGGNVNFLYLDHVKGLGAQLTIKNCLIVVDRLDDWNRDWDPVLDYNVLVSPKDYPHIRGKNGRWFKSLDGLVIGGSPEDFNYAPSLGSPLLGAGEGGVTVGPYDYGEASWRRPLAEAFTDKESSLW